MWCCVAGPVPGGPEPEHRARWLASWLSQAVVQGTPLWETPEDSAGWAISAGQGACVPLVSPAIPAAAPPGSHQASEPGRVLQELGCVPEPCLAGACPAGADARPGIEGLGGRSPFLPVFSKEMNSECHLSDFF